MTSLDLLNQALSNEFALQQKTIIGHWNVQGSNFLQLHKLYEEQYGELQTHADDLAERIRGLGARTPTTPASLLAESKVRNWQADWDDTVQELVADRQQLVKQYQEWIAKAADLGDALTEDLLTAIAQDHMKALYLLQSHLENEATPSAQAGKQSAEEAQ